MRSLVTGGKRPPKLLDGKTKLYDWRKKNRKRYGRCLNVILRVVLILLMGPILDNVGATIAFRLLVVLRIRHLFLLTMGKRKLLVGLRILPLNTM